MILSAVCATYAFSRPRYTGKERDQETGLDYFGARYFSAVQGRWISSDWSPTPQPVPYADLTELGNSGDGALILLISESKSGDNPPPFPVGRIVRVIAVGLPHHVTQRDNGRRAAFHAEQDRMVYLRLLREYGERYAVRWWSSCRASSEWQKAAAF